MSTHITNIDLYNCPECRWIDEPIVWDWPSFNQRCAICKTQQFYSSLDTGGDPISDICAVEKIEKRKSNPDQQNKQLCPIRSRTHHEWIRIKTNYYQQIFKNIIGLNSDVNSLIIEILIGGTVSC
jgi:hypothetical protein